jgi:transposase
VERKAKSWTLSDEFWEQIKDHIPQPKRDPNRSYQRKQGGGRKPMDPRQVLEGILYVLRTGCQWKALPKEYGSASSVHKYFQFWREEGFFETIWAAGLHTYDEMEGIGWEWQSIDGSMIKAPLALEAVGRNPTDRGKKRNQAQPAGGAERVAAGHRHRRSEHA